MTSLYVLREPKTGAIRYVGKTAQSLGQRLSNHLVEARSGRKDYRCNWLRSLSTAPDMDVVAIVRGRYASRAEQFAIALMRASGERLVNDTDGGEGQPGRIPSAETRAKMSVAHRGRKFPGRKLSPETRAKIGRAHLGRRVTPQNRANMRAAWVIRKSKAALSGRG